MPKPTVPFKVLRDPPPEARISADGPVIRASFLVDWIDAFTFANQAKGFILSSGGTVIVRQPPWQYPDLPAVFARDVRLVPVGVKRGVGAGPCGEFGLRPGEFWEFCRAEVEFGVPPVGELPDPPSQDPGGQLQIFPGDPIAWAESDIDAGSEAVTYGEGSWLYKSDNKPLPFRNFRTLGRADIVFRIPQLPFMPWSIWKRYLNKINHEVFLGEPARTIRFDTFRTSSTAMTDGTVQKRVEMRFAWRELPWDEVIRPETGVADQVIAAGTSKPFHEPDDLRQIFRAIGL